MLEILRSPPTIETERLVIRLLRLADAESIFEYAQDPEVTRFVAFETHSNIEVSRAFINKALDSYEKFEPCALAIDLKSESKLIGSIGYHNWKEKDRCIEIGYALSKPYWGLGIISEATQELIHKLFIDSDLVRIEARCDARHVASARVMEKIGMQFEGILRKQLFSKGEQCDMMIYSILRDEWKRQNSN